jgi:hypothetical protein
VNEHIGMRCVQSADDPSVVSDDIRIVKDHQYRLIGECIDTSPELVRVPDIVLIAECNQLALAQVSRSHEIRSISKPPLIDVDAYRKWRGGGKSLDDEDGIVGRTVIRYDKLRRHTALRRQAPQLPFDIAATIIGRHRNRHAV